jgi:hypothetical protein
MRAVTGMIAVALSGWCSACGDGLTFPELSADMIATFCVRGTATVGETLSGAVTAEDCDAADFSQADPGYYESWRVRVGSATTVTFAAESPFDNLLLLLRLESDTDTLTSFEIVAVNDDRATGDFNALITATLQPDEEYFLLVRGFDYLDVGTYSVAIQ